MLLLPIFLFSQNYEKEGDDLFSQAQYEKAEKKFNAAIVIFGEIPTLKQKQKDSSKCASLIANATIAENESRYGEAAKYYSDLYAIHALPKYKSKAAALEQKAKQMLQVSNNIYDLVVGSYTDDAKEPLREIRAKGYRDAFLVAIVDDNGCPRNRVIAKRVYSKEEARKVQKALTNQGIKSWIWRH